MTAALLGAALAAALPAAAAMAGTPALAAVLLAEQLAFGWAWVVVLRASRPTVLLLTAAALTADGAVLGAARHDLGSLAGVVGAGIAVVIVYQLIRRQRAGAGPTATPSASPEGSAPTARMAPPAPGMSAPPTPTPTPTPTPARVTGELAAALGGGTLVAFLAGLLALRAQPGSAAPGDLLVAVGLAGAGGAVLVAWLTGLLGAGTLVAAGLGLSAGTGMGAVYGAYADELSAGSGALLAAAGALAAAVMGVLIARASASSPTPAPVPATASRSSAGAAAAPADETRPVPAARPAAASGSAGARVWRAGRGALGDLRSPAAPLLLGGVRVGPIAARPVATALLAAVAPLTIAAPLIYLVGRHL
ncbi:hypothetical protein [Pseudofrankia asymbiotica]|uniref:Uncharacterized protein n=1 Tax=Pseudofrankia asymbiotica TaxID=1834516 RepID=A0A1V2IAU6_9ACTN|nr:hypothetical protein [Pseudofrankia asymbiotica]ONH30227.1 hypothetical protein BL253_15030 [Pseudofrankia asymbiotica]